MAGDSAVEGALRRLWAARKGLLELFLGVLLPLGLFAALASDVVRRRQPWWDTALLEWIPPGPPVFGRTTPDQRLGVWCG
jgi:hypothetical protein